MVHLRVRRFAGFDCERFLRRIRVFGRRFTRGRSRRFLPAPSRDTAPGSPRSRGWRLSIALGIIERLPTMRAAP